ncbi:MAG: MSHA biogenesis protein MshP [Pseudomonadota bacterium]
MNSATRQTGFAYVAAVVALVAMALMALAVVRLSTTSQTTASQDLLAVRATQAARSGIEWGMYLALRSGTCNTGTLDFSGETGLGMHVTVTCTSTTYKEGESAPGTPIQKVMYKIDAVACNSTTCPDNTQATNATYVERRRIATACTTTALGDC